MMKYNSPSILQKLHLHMRRAGRRRMCLVVCGLLGLYVMVTLMDGSAAPRPKQTYVHYFPDRQWKDRNQDGVKTILLWTKRFGYDYWAMDKHWDASECPVSKCRLTRDRKFEESADAVLFHSRALWNNFMGALMPENRSPHQVYVYHNQEPAFHTFLNLRRYSGVFNWTSTYRLDSDVPGPYSKMVKLTDAWSGWEEEDDPVILKRGNTVGDTELVLRNNTPNYHSQKTGLMAWTASNCIDQRRRVRLVNALGEHLPIHRYGKCGNMTLRCNEWFRCDENLAKYKFVLSLENSVCTDYVSEKFFLPFQRNQIPVVFSDGVMYARHAPPSSYIDARDFGSVKELADYIKKVAADPVLYNSYFWWQHFYKIQPDLHTLLFCNLCKKLHDQNTPAQVYTDLHGWFNRDMWQCPQFTVPGFVSRVVEGMALRMGIIS